jgi:hypothetical protein
MIVHGKVWQCHFVDFPTLKWMLFTVVTLNFTPPPYTAF